MVKITFIFLIKYIYYIFHLIF